MLRTRHVGPYPKPSLRGKLVSGYDANLTGLKYAEMLSKIAERVDRGKSDGTLQLEVTKLRTEIGLLYQRHLIDYAQRQGLYSYIQRRISSDTRITTMQGSRVDAPRFNW